MTDYNNSYGQEKLMDKTPAETKYAEAITSIIEPYALSLERVDALESFAVEVNESFEVIIDNLLLLLNHPNANEIDHRAWRDIALGTLASIQEKAAEIIEQDEQ